jgi:hypothetical protein
MVGELDYVVFKRIIIFWAPAAKAQHRASNELVVPSRSVYKLRRTDVVHNASPRFGETWQ